MCVKGVDQHKCVCVCVSVCCVACCVCALVMMY